MSARRQTRIVYGWGLGSIGRVTFPHATDSKTLFANSRFECIGRGRSVWRRKAEVSRELIENTKRLPMEPTYCIGPDVHKRKISYCVTDSSGKLHSEGSIPATCCDLDKFR